MKFLYVNFLRHIQAVFSFYSGSDYDTISETSTTKTTTEILTQSTRYCSLDCVGGYCIRGWRGSPDYCFCYEGVYDEKTKLCVAQLTTPEPITTKPISTTAVTTSTTTYLSSTSTPYCSVDCGEAICMRSKLSYLRSIVNSVAVNSVVSVNSIACLLDAQK